MTMRWMLAALLVLAGCGDDASDDAAMAGEGGASGDSGKGGSGGEPGGPGSFDDQVEHGAVAYAEHCAHCHGDMGQGTADGPPVVGEGALPREPPEGSTARSTEFRTALDVFEFVTMYMPGDDPGALETATYVDILAFALFANGVELDEPLDAEVAEALVLNP